MNLSQAADILGLTPGTTADEATVKAAFRRAAQKYHPDKGGSTEMMQAVNAAYDFMQANYGTVPNSESGAEGYGDRLNDAINAIIHLRGLSIEVCGLWVWVSGDTRTHKEALKAAGYFWASKQFMWYVRPAEQAGSRKNGGKAIDEIRSKYGSVAVKQRMHAAIA